MLNGIIIIVYEIVDNKGLDALIDQKTLLDLSNRKLLIMSKDIKLLDCVGKGKQYVKVHRISHNFRWIWYCV